MIAIRNGHRCDVQQRQRNHHIGNTSRQAAEPVDEQIRHGSWPRDHEKGDPETHRVERRQNRQRQQ